MKILIAISFLCVLFTSAALAQPADPAVEADSAPAPSSAPVPASTPPNTTSSATTPATSTPKPSTPSSRHGVRTHDGFMFRFTPGLGYAIASYTNGFEITGAGIAGNLVVGVHVGPRVALVADSAGVMATNPTLTGVGTVDATYSTYFLGVGAIAYGPSNAYFQGSIGGAWFSLSDEGTVTSNTGIAGRVVLGKEWWVSDNWGLGVAGHVMMGSTTEEITPGIVNDVALYSFGVHMSATYD